MNPSSSFVRLLREAGHRTTREDLSRPDDAAAARVPLFIIDFYFFLSLVEGSLLLLLLSKPRYPPGGPA